MRTVRPVIASNRVPYLQMGLIGSHRALGRKREEMKERNCFTLNETSFTSKHPQASEKTTCLKGCYCHLIYVYRTKYKLSSPILPLSAAIEIKNLDCSGILTVFRRTKIKIAIHPKCFRYYRCYFQ